MSFEKMLKIILVFFAVIIVGLVVFISTFDPNKYRDALSTALEKKLGRSVKLEGDISLGYSLHGMDLSIQNVVVGNPAWASRSDLAKIGQVKLGLALPPLLMKKVVVTQFDLADADIKLETNKDGQHNWDMKTETAPENVEKPVAPKPVGQNVMVQIDKVTIQNSSLAVSDQTGKTSLYQVKDLTLGMDGAQAKLQGEASVDGTPVALTVTTGITHLMAGGAGPFTADVKYGAYQLHAVGTVDTDKKEAVVNEYSLTAGGSTIKGKLAAKWGGAKPSATGTIESAHLDPADFKPAPKADSKAATTGESAGEANGGYVLSDKSLPLDGLKAVNAGFDVKIDDLVLGKGNLKNLTARLDLKDGDLTIRPFQADLGASPVKGELRLNAASSPAQMGLVFTASDVAVADLMKLADKPAFLSGKGSADIHLSGAGNSLHDMASNLNGTMILTAEGGQVDAGLVGQASSLLLGIVTGGTGGNPELRCMATRFNVVNGVAHDNGILADATTTTMLGAGGLDFRNETIDLTLKAHAHAGAVGNLLPSVHVGGTFRSPSYRTDVGGTVQGVIGLLSKGKVAKSDVPDIMVAPAGQNACVYTLDHRVAAGAEPAGVLPANPVDRAKQQIQNLGGALKGLLGQ